MGHNKNKKHMVEAGWPLIGLNKKHKELVEKVLSMGYMADQVINSIQRLEGSGQPVEFNVVLDQLNEPSSRGGSHKLWWILQAFQKSFVQVQSILDQNRLLINEINTKHESKIPDNLSRNVSLIRDLNNNIKRVVSLYADLSSSFIHASSSAAASSEGESSNHKRIRPGKQEKETKKKGVVLGP